MAQIARLVLEVSGKCDGQTIVELLDRASGVEARELLLQFDDMRSMDPAAVEVLAGALRRFSATNLRLHGLPAREAGALTRLGVPVEVMVAVRPTPRSA